ncbi:hypothetical protein Tco_0973137 [Tanacetum coccineum]
MVACLEKIEGNFDFHEIVDFLASSLIHHALTIDATVDSKAVVVTEASIRSSLLFNDADGTTCLTNEAIFQNLALMGYEEPEPAKKMTRIDFDAAQIARDAEIARQLQEYTIKERAKFLAETIDAQRKFRAAQRSAEIRSRPPTKSQLRNLMMTYLKNMGGYKYSQLKAKSFEEIKGMYERQKKSVQDFVPIGSAKEEELIKKMNEKATDEDTSNKEKVLEEPESTKVEVKQEGTKKRKLGTRKKMKSRKRRFRQGTSKGDKTDSDIEKENDALRLYLTIIFNKDKEVDYEILDKKYPIIEWKYEYHGIKPQFDETKDLEEINMGFIAFKIFVRISFCPEYADDEIVVEDQPGAEDAPPTTQSPDYILDTESYFQRQIGVDKLDIEEDEDDDIDINANEEDEDDEMDIEVDEVAKESTQLLLPCCQTACYIFPTSITTISMVFITTLTVLTAPPPSPIRSLGYRAATIRIRAEAAATSHSLPLPPPFILSPTRPDAPPPMPTSAPTSLPPFMREDQTSTQRDMLDMDQIHGRDTDKSNAMLVDEQSRDSYWPGRKVMSLRTTVHAQMSAIIELQSADHSRRRAISDLLETDRGRREEMRELRVPDAELVTTLQGHGLTALQGQSVIAFQAAGYALQGQQGPVGGPAQPELLEEAGSSS